ncbi:MAG: ABC transporter permease [Mycoplasma sp.]|nr:ABC transporter permease [Mycoplasma sp.]
MTIFKTYWKIVKKNIGIIILYTVMLLVFGTMNLKANKNSFEFISSKPDIIIVNNSSGIITDNLISYLKTNANVKNITNENDIDDAVFFRDANYVIYIPKDFETKLESGKEVNIDIKTNNSYDSYIASELLNRYLDVFSKYMNLYNDKILAIQKLDNTLNKKASVIIENKTSLNSKTSLFYNFSSYSIMAIVIYIICLVLSSFNDEKISKRTNVSGMSYKTFNNYLYISSFTFTFIIFIVYLILSFLILKSSILNINGILYGLNMFIFFIVSFTMAILISNLVKSKGAISGVVNVISLGSAFLCGAFIPVKYMPSFALKIAHIFPTFYFIDNNEYIASLQNFDKASYDFVLKNFIIMTVFIIFFLILNTLVTRLKRKVN